MEKDIRGIISKNISTLRKKNGYTQQELGDLLFFSDKAVSKWERGASLPDAETLYKIAELFNVPISYLYEEHNDVIIEKEIEDNLKKKQKIYLFITISTFIVISLSISLIIIGYFLEEFNIKASFVPYLLFSFSLICLLGGVYNNIFRKKKVWLYIIFYSLTIWSITEGLTLLFTSRWTILLFIITFFAQVVILLIPFILNYTRKK